jgi:hypothetical protein
MFKIGQQVQHLCDLTPMYFSKPHYIRSIGPKWITTTANIRIPVVGTHAHFSIKAV